MAENTLRYIKLDYASHKEALLQRIRARWPLTWNDFTSNSLGMVIVDIIAWTTATLAFTINRLAAENFIPTMTLRESAVRFGKLTGYQLRGPQPAVVLCEAELSSTVAGDVTISQGTIIRVGTDAIPFEVSQDYTIAAGKTTPEDTKLFLSATSLGSLTVSSNVQVTNGSSYIDVVDSTTDLTSYISAGQTFRVPTDNVYYTIIDIEAAPGASGNNRMVVSPVYAGTTAEVAGEVFERRISLSQGQTVTDRFITPAIETPNYSARLTRGSIIDGSVAVTINGEPWTQVTSNAVQGSEAKTFEVNTLSTGQTLVQFGDGQFGAIAPPDGVLIVVYRVGGGISGNISTNAISTSITGLLAGFQNPVTISLKNSSSAGQGGRDAETLEEARVNIPASVKTNDRAVTLDDYQTLAQGYTHPQYGSVAYARAAVRTENSLLEGNMVVVYAWTTGPAGSLVTLNSTLKTALKEYLQTKAVGTDWVAVFDGTSRPVPVSFRFTLLPNYNVNDTKYLLLSRLGDFVSVLRPGQPLIYSDMVRWLDETTGVDSIQMATPISDVQSSNPTELLTVPDDSYSYPLEFIENSTDGSYTEYKFQLPVYPVQAWAFALQLGGIDLLVVPHTTAGYARVLGTNVLSNKVSTINMLTGQGYIWLNGTGAAQALTMKLTTAQGIERQRAINLYIGYTGENSQSKRREIRAALRAWNEGQGIGGSLFAAEITNISASVSNVTAVVEAITGTGTVTRVALDSPTSSETRVVASQYELIKLGVVTINSSGD